MINSLSKSSSKLPLLLCTWTSLIFYIPFISSVMYYSSYLRLHDQIKVQPTVFITPGVLIHFDWGVCSIKREFFSVTAVMSIQTKYSVKKNWEGDPCSPAAFTWDGLNCSYSSHGPERIIALWVLNEITHVIFCPIFIGVALQSNS